MTGKVDLSDFEKARKYWVEFYERYNIDASSLKNIHLTEDGLETQKEMMEKYGFDKLVMIPKGVSVESLLANDKMAIFTESGEGKQNTGKNGKIKDWSEEIIGSDEWKQKTDKPQIIFLKNKKEVDSMEDETMKKISAGTTRNATYPRVIKMENDLGLEGLDLVEAMIVDRQNFDITGHHLWDRTDNNAVWLTKTANKIKAGRCVRLFWTPLTGQWLLRLGNKVDYDDDQGSVFTRSLEIENK